MSGRPRPAGDLFSGEASAAPAERRLVQVMVPVALDQSYTYRVPPGTVVVPGSIVRIPLGPRQSFGVVTDEAPTLGEGSNRLRAIEHVFDVPPLRPELLALVDWVSRYTLTPRGMV